MEMFARFKRRAAGAADEATDAIAIDPGIQLPRINTRVTIVSQRRGISSPSRVDDDTPDTIVLSAPDIALRVGDAVELQWDTELTSYAFETTVTRIAEVGAHRPTIALSREGKVVKASARRARMAAPIALPVEVRTIAARGVPVGHSFRTRTMELTGQSVSFPAADQYGPGDMLDVRIALPDGDIIGFGAKVIRIGIDRTSAERIVVCAFHDILRSDRIRVQALLESNTATRG